MSVLTSHPALRWLVPASAAVAVLGGGAAIAAVTAAVDKPSLPARSAAQLLVDVQSARLDGLSGTIVQNADLGIPALPALGGGGSADLTSLISGTHTLRVWYSGPDHARLALMGTLGETDVITNGTDLWTWSSTQNTATHRTLPAGGLGAKAGTAHPTPSGLPSLGSLTPEQIANGLLAMIGTTTDVTTSSSVRVAGRDAYELVLAPRSTASLVGSVRVAIDATEHVPLRVQIFARNSDTPSLEVGFTQISFARPDASEFVFNPPKGATVKEEKAPTPDASATPDMSKPDLGALAKGALGSGALGSGALGKDVAIVGKGWTTVVVAKLPTGTGAGDGSTASPGTKGGGDPMAALQGLVKQLPTVSGTWGSGHVLSGKLFTVLLTDDGRVLVGAVTPATLYQAAADPAAKLGG